MMKEAQLHQPVAISEGGATVLISFATTEGQTRKIAERILQISESEVMRRSFMTPQCGEASQRSVRSTR